LWPPFSLCESGSMGSRTASGAARIQAHATASGALARSIPVRATALPMLAIGLAPAR